MTALASKITFVLPVFNEAHVCELIYKYYSRYANVICFDNFSTDDTYEKLIACGCQNIVKFRNDGTTQSPEWVANAIRFVHTPYVIFCSCSEIISQPLLNILPSLIIDGGFAMIRCGVTTITNGEEINIHGGSLRRLTKSIERIFKISELDIASIRIHSPMKTVQGSKFPVYDLSGIAEYNITHIRTGDTHSLLLKHNAYAKVEASSHYKHGHKISLLSLIILVLKELLKFVQNKPTRWRLNLTRELFLRIIMHILIYLYLAELHERSTLLSSRSRSIEAIEQLTI